MNLCIIEQQNTTAEVSQFCFKETLWEKKVETLTHYNWIEIDYGLSRMIYHSKSMIS